MEIKKHKKEILIAVISAIVLIVIFGSTFAFWLYSQTSGNQILVSGDIYMKFSEGNEINIKNAMPIDINNYYYEEDTLNTNMTPEELSGCVNLFNSLLNNYFKAGENAENFCKGTGTGGGVTIQQYVKQIPAALGTAKSMNIFIESTKFNASPDGYMPLSYIEYTIEGTNTYNKDINYEVLLQQGAEDTTRGKRLKDNLLAFRLVEVIGETEKEIFTNRSYDKLDNTKIYIDTIPAKTNTKITKKYRLYMWISNKTAIGVGDNIDYDMDTWNNKVYASVKLQVNGDFNDKTITYDKEVATTKIKNTLGKANGVIGLNSQSERVISASSDIREYRYSGPVVDNYVYYNCEDENNQTQDTCELWRIVGVFTDNKGEHLKIVKNSPLEGSKLPLTYTVNGKKYNIVAGEGVSFAYWSFPVDENFVNDWTIAGIQYYLNSESDDNEANKGYLSYLKDYSKNMIEETTYYLGNVTYGYESATSYGIIDTPKEAYNNERNSLSCSSDSDCGGGYIWPSNKAIWTGKVGLLYPSDYGFSASSNYWDTKMSYNSFDGKAANSSWLQNTANASGEWLLSPSSRYSRRASYWHYSGYVTPHDVDDRNGRSLHPTFYLVSSAMIGPGTGVKMDPYWLMSA